MIFAKILKFPLKFPGHNMDNDKNINKNNINNIIAEDFSLCSAIHWWQSPYNEFWQPNPEYLCGWGLMLQKQPLPL